MLMQLAAAPATCKSAIAFFLYVVVNQSIVNWLADKKRFEA